MLAQVFGGVNEQTKRWLFEHDGFIDPTRRLINDFLTKENNYETNQNVYFTDMLARLEC